MGNNDEHYPPNRMINVLNCLFFYSFFPQHFVTLCYGQVKSSSVSMKFDEFKLLTRKSCFCLACNKSFSLQTKGKKNWRETQERRSLLNLMDNFVCLPIWLVSWCNSCWRREKSCLINILSASFFACRIILGVLPFSIKDEQKNIERL